MSGALLVQAVPTMSGGASSGSAFDSPTVIGAIITAVVAVLIFLGGRWWERRQLIWSKKLDRLTALEELAGEVAEELSTYRAAPPREWLTEKLGRLESAAGQFARYEAVRQAVRELANSVSWMADCKEKRDAPEIRTTRTEIHSRLRDLLDAIDKETGRR